jgi:CBS domain-containing protein
MKHLPIHQFMTKNPLSVPHDMSISKALSVMELNGFRHLPVTKDGVPFSVISSREIHLILAQSENEESVQSEPVGDFCPIDMIRVSPEASLDEVLDLFINEKIGTVIINDNDQFAGIFSLVDVCKVLKGAIQEKA